MRLSTGRGDCSFTSSKCKCACRPTLTVRHCPSSSGTSCVTRLPSRSKYKDSDRDSTFEAISQMARRRGSRRRRIGPARIRGSAGASEAKEKGEDIRCFMSQRPSALAEEERHALSGYRERTPFCKAYFRREKALNARVRCR